MKGFKYERESNRAAYRAGPNPNVVGEWCAGNDQKNAGKMRWIEGFSHSTNNPNRIPSDSSLNQDARRMISKKTHME